MLKYIKTKLKSQKNKIKEKGKSTSGFTLAEVLIVVAIMLILMGLGTVAVLNYQKSLKLTEMDATARQIFVAAQNHMTAAKASGEWDTISNTYDADNAYFGQKMTVEPLDYVSATGEAWPLEGAKEGKHRFYYINSNRDMHTLDTTILAEALPFGAIDDTVRLGGSYIIEYDYTTASVYSVFYSDTKVSADEIYTAMCAENSDGRNDKNVRKNNKPIIGYYGGTVATKESSVELNPIELNVENSDKLTVQISDPNFYLNNSDNSKNRATKIVLNVVGEESKAKLVMPLELSSYNSTGNPGKNNASALINETWWKNWTVEKQANALYYEIVLDDITSKGSHFAEIFGKSFIPGENLTVKVSCTSTEELSNTVTDEDYTNSLFESKYNKTVNAREISTATVSSIRHLQNLNSIISNLPLDTNLVATPSVERVVKEVTQTKDLDWTENTDLFVDGEGSNQSWAEQTIYKYSDSGESEAASDKSFFGVVNKSLESYDGGNHTLTNFVLGSYTFENKKYSGIFPVLGTAGDVQTTIKNLQVKNPTATEDTSATGAIVGLINGTGATISNCSVFVQDAAAYERAFASEAINYLYTGTNGNVGGLVGLVEDKGGDTNRVIIENSFASVPIKGVTGNAGGLIGTINKAKTLVTNSYSGGYTKEKLYSDDFYNIQLTDMESNVGGLIGLVSADSKIQNCYSTCSVYGNNVGGLIGVDESSNSQYINTYTVGLIAQKEGSTGNKGTFAGQLPTSATIKSCYFLSGVNGTLKAVNNTDNDNIIGMDYTNTSTGLALASYVDDYESSETYKKPENSDIENAKHFTKHYDTEWSGEGSEYPFATVNNATDASKTGVQVGDWQMETAVPFDAEIAYYEIYQKEGQYTLGLYNSSLDVNTLITDPDASNTDIVQDGYVVLTTLDGETKVDSETTYGIESLIINNAGNISVTPSGADDEDAWTFEDKLANDSTYQVNDKNYLLRFMGLSTVDRASGTSYYSSMVVSNSTGVDNFTFYLNPHYAMSSIAKYAAGVASSAPRNPSTNTNNPILIRSERQYSMFSQDLQNFANNNTYKLYAGLYYRQGVNLTFAESLTYTKTYFSRVENTKDKNISGVAAVEPIVVSPNRTDQTKPFDSVGFAGTYDGAHHTITALNLSVEEGSSQAAGMFGFTNHAIIQNLTLQNMVIDGSNALYTGSLIGSAAHSGGINTQIKNVSVNNAQVKGNSYVGGLVGMAYSCAASDINLQDNTVTGNNIVGGAFGSIMNFGTSVEKKYMYQNINISATVPGGYSVIQNGGVDSASATGEIGCGGFVGKLAPYYETNTKGGRQIVFDTITLDGINISATTTGNTNSQISGGLWAGSYSLDSNMIQVYGNDFVTDKDVSYIKCNVKNSMLSTSGKSSVEDSASYGGLYGRIILWGNNASYTNSTFENTNTKMAIHTGVNFENSEITNSANSTDGSVTIGGLVGTVKKAKLVFSEAELASYSLPTITGFTDGMHNTYGVYVGTLEDSTLEAEFKGSEGYLLPNAVTQESVAAANYGGFIGKLSNSTLSGIKQSSGSITLSDCGNSQNVGGVIGYSLSSEISDIDVENIKISCSGAENVGGVIGATGSGTSTITRTVSNLKVGGNTLINGAVNNAGGIVGKIEDATFSDIVFGKDVSQKELLLSPSESVDATGATNAGGVVGQISSGSIENSVARNVQVSGSQNTGGFVGLVSGTGTVTESNADNVIVNDGRYVGGFAAEILNSRVKACDVRLSAIYNNEGTSSTGEYKVTANTSEAYIGGFVGHLQYGTLTQCFAAIPVTSSSPANLGGFVGLCDDAKILYSYASGNVSNAGYAQNTSTGGFAGEVKKVSEIDDCYSTGNVLRGGRIGGFTGTIAGESVVYLNNSYSLGTVDQQKGTGLEYQYHGGFIGYCNGDLQEKKGGYSKEIIEKFYAMLSLDIRTPSKNTGYDFTGEDLNILNECVRRMNTRNQLDKTVADNMRRLKNGHVDSTSSDMVNGNYSIASIIKLMTTLSMFQDINGKVTSWRFDVQGQSSYYFVCTDTDITKLQNSANIQDVYWYKNAEDNGTEITATVGKETTYNIITPNYNAPVVSEKFTGGAYLQDSTYNVCDNWYDANNSLRRFVKSQSFVDFKNGEYLKELNTDNNTEILASRFEKSASFTFRYNKKLEDPNYSFPTLNFEVGKTTNLRIPKSNYWGDWPENNAPDVGLVYYEVIDGKTYYRGYLASYADKNDSNPNYKYQEIYTSENGEELNLEKGLVTNAGKTVTEDGYLVLLPKGIDIGKMFVSLAGQDRQRAVDVLTSATGLSLAGDVSEYDVYYLNCPYNNYQFPAGAANVQIGDSDGDPYNPQMGKNAIFKMTPSFAATVAKVNEDKTSYEVRSARQLTQFTLREWSMLNNPEIVFEQTLDIDFAKGNYTEKGQRVAAYAYTAPTLSNATYQSKIVAADNQKAGYVINGLNSYLFSSNGGVIKGVTLTNVNSNEGSAGFVQTNSGTIESCAIRAKNVDDTSYDDVVISNSGNASGFVNTNSGTIKNSYVVGTVTSKNGTASGFVNTNEGGTIENCYVNCVTISTGSNNTASGFCDTNRGTIRDSHVLYSLKAEGNAYGFVKLDGTNGKKITDCYVALNHIKGTNCYTFEGTRDNANEDLNNGYYLNTTVIDATNNTEYSGSGKTRDELSNLDINGQGTATETTHKYQQFNTDPKDITYPFALPSTEAYLTMQHYGDWPGHETTGLVYYEKVDDKFYYNGYARDYAAEGDFVSLQSDENDATGGLLKNTTGGLLKNTTGKYVTEDGYLILIEKDADIADKYVQFGVGETYPMADCATKVSADDSITHSSLADDYDIYYLDFHNTSNANGLDAYKSGAAKLVVGDKTSNTYGSNSFSMTPYFADSVKTNSDTAQKEYGIRSARQLVNLSKLTTYSGNSGYTFEQGMDISFATGDASYTVQNKDKDNSATPITYRYTTIATMLANYQTETIKDGNQMYGYQIKGLTTNMFGVIGTANALDAQTSIKGITLTDLVATDSGKNGVAFAKNNYGIIDSCTVRPSGKDYGTVKISRNGDGGGSNPGLATAGFIWTNERTGIIRNSSFIGTVELSPSNRSGWANLTGFADINKGTIENSYTNCNLNFYALESKTDYNAIGFCMSNREDGKINNCHAISNINFYYNNAISTNVGRGIGFVKNNGDGETSSNGSITKSYSVLNGLSAKQKYAFILQNRSGSTSTNNCYLELKNGTFNDTTGATLQTYAQMQAQAAEDEVEATAETTHPYRTDLAGIAYPFSLSGTSDAYLTMQHWGDWPEPKRPPIGLIYYEKVGGKVYYHGYVSKYDPATKTMKQEEIKSTEPFVTTSKSYVTEDGYLVLLPSDVDHSQVTVKIGSSIVTNTSYLGIVGDYALKNAFDGYVPYYFGATSSSSFNSGIANVSFAVEASLLETSMTPYFADTVGKTTGSDAGKTEFEIRSARQLSNLQNKSSYSTTSTYKFKQTLDISYTGVSTTENNAAKTYNFSTIQKMSASYKSALNPNITTVKSAYEIKGLKTNFIETVDTGATIEGVTLTNLNATAQAGFAVINNGTINSCGIRPEDNEGMRYNDVVIKPSTSGVLVRYNNAAGFVYTNVGTIKNSYVSGRIEESTSSGNQATIAGFVYENKGIIEASYADCEIDIRKSFSIWNPIKALGFVYSNTEGAKIDNCHALNDISVYSGGVSLEYAYGFIESNRGTVLNSYSAMNSMSAKNVYAFGGDTNGTYTNCHFLAENLSSPIIYSSARGATYQSLRKMAVDDQRVATAEITNRYNVTDLSDIYPFMLPYTESAYLTMQHYGDWPEVTLEVSELGLVYYEKLEGDDEIYYHGYDSNGNEISSPNGGLVAGKENVVSESGYLLLTEQAISDGYIGINTTTISSSQSPKILQYFENYNNNLNGYNSYKMIDSSKIEELYADKANKVRFQIDTETYDFTMTPYFADSVISGFDDETTFYIRSAADFINFKGERTKGFADVPGYTFIQQLDIDAEQFEISEGYVVKELGGTYRALTCLDEDGNRASYVISNLKGGFIKDIETTGAVYNVVIENLQVNNNSFSAGFVEKNKGIISNCCIRPDADSDTISYENSMLSGDNEISGFAAKNEGNIQNSYFVGTIISADKASGFCEANTGVIESCYSNAYVTSTGKNAFGFGEKVDKTGIIRNCHVLGTVASTSKNAYGFIRQINTRAIVENSYVALNYIKGSKVYAFADEKNANAILTNGQYYVAESSGGIQTCAGTAAAYTDLAAQTINYPATESTTHRFTSTLPDVYPFALPKVETSFLSTTMQHYGDWPVDPAATNSLEEDATTFSLETPTLTEEVSKPVEQQTATSTGIAYHESNVSDYDGWYAIVNNAIETETSDVQATDSQELDVTAVDDVPYNTLITDRNIILADTDTSYGILITAGSKPEVTGAKIEDDPSATVVIDDVTYDYYKLVADEKHEDVEITVKELVEETTDTTQTAVGAAEKSVTLEQIPYTYIYNDDFAASISAGKPLGVTAEEGGRPYQIRTNQQLRNISEGEGLYLDKAFRQTMDVALTADNFDPIGGTSTWTEDGVTSFTGSYDAGLIGENKDMTESSTDATKDASGEVPQGYKITGFNQTLIFNSVDGNSHTGKDETKNDKYKQLAGGLFASVEGTVRGVNVSGNLDIRSDGSASFMTGAVGSVAGNIAKNGSLVNVNSDVMIQVDTQCLDLMLGGMAGNNAGTINNSYYTGWIQNHYYDENSSGQLYLQNLEGYTAKVGGFVGYNSGKIYKSAASANIVLTVNNSTKSAPIFGGFVGWTGGKDSLITNSWSKSIIANGKGTLGGFVGFVSGAEKMTDAATFTNDYAIVRFDNADPDALIGLFIGNNGTTNIGRCFAGEMDGSGYVTATTKEFQNGQTIKPEDVASFVWNGVGEIPFTTLNGENMWNLSNSVYPTLSYNGERTTDLNKVVGGVNPSGDTATVTEATSGATNEGTTETPAEEAIVSPTVTPGISGEPTMTPTATPTPTDEPVGTPAAEPDGSQEIDEKLVSTESVLPETDNTSE